MRLMKIILGSKSPRRKELLAGLGIDFSIVDIDADESYPTTLQGGEIPIYISRAKADAYKSHLKADELLITADTIVWLDGRVLGKPEDEAEAKAMVRLLSGHTHQVFTGVTLTLANGTQTSFVDTTDVSFRELTEEEIDFYVMNFRPLDKAGAYGIQEWIGYAACTNLHGSYFNVMGLPTEKLYEALKPHIG
ncbi:MAG: septum formation protein Maf [Bacteroidales bacterium]|nr:septum formation protein Maf [Candidatus Colicola faecequi]